jgi:protein-tyrosine-phosphatase
MNELATRRDVASPEAGATSTRPARVLFVCTGNTCRSPLAAAFARKLADERRMFGLSFDSAGTGAFDGGGASEAAILVGIERGVDLSAHRTRALTPALIAEADFVLVMGPQHLETVRIHGSESKVRLLDHFTSGGETSNAINLRERRSLSRAPVPSVASWRTPAPTRTRR